MTKPIRTEPVHTRSFFSLSAIISYGIVAIVAYLTLAVNLDGQEFWLPDELIHVSVVQDMWENGSYFRPQLRGEDYLNKPPLKMWLTLPFLALFGTYKWVYRAPDVLFAVANLTLIVFLARRYFRSYLVGVVACLFICGSTAYVNEHTARMAVQDSALCFFLTVVLGLLLEIERQLTKLESGSISVAQLRLTAIAIGAVSGMACLVKSVAGILGLLVFYTFFSVQAVLLSRSKKVSDEQFSSRVWQISLLPAIACLVVSGIYYLPHLVVTPNAFNIIFLQEVAQRATEGYHHAGETSYYWEHLLKGSYGSPALVMLAIAVGVWGMIAVKSRQVQLLLTWVVVIAAIFQLSASKLVHYLNPSLCSIGLLVGLLFQSLIASCREAMLFGKLKTARTGFGLVVLCFAGWQLWYFLHRTQEMSSKDHSELLLDRVVSAMRASFEPAGERTQVAYYKAPEFGFYEKPYLNMLMPSTRSYTDTKEILADAVPWVITSPRHLEEVLKNRVVRSYRYLPPPRPIIPTPPFAVRKQWAILLGFSQRWQEPLFGQRQLVHFADRAFREMAIYGFEGTTQAGDLPVRVAEVEGASFLLTGTLAHKRYGAQLLVNCMAKTAFQHKTHKGELKMYLNQQPLGTKSLSEEGLQTIEFDVPGSYWRSGKNIVSFSFQPRAGDKPQAAVQMLMRWLSVRVRFPGAELVEVKK